MRPRIASRPEEIYSQAREGRRGILAERPPHRDGHVPELELQAHFFHGAYGVQWLGEDGERVEILHSGSWNREPGPDFVGARLSIDGVEKRGDVEIDLEAKDWESHGHSRNPNYDNVILHVFFRRGGRRYFTKTTENRLITQACVPVDDIVTLPPRAGGGAWLDEREAVELAEAAAAFRLRRKGEGFRRATLLCGGDEAVFQGIAAAMGYKNNKIPFLLLSQRAGLARAAAADGEALLFGLAGFLNAERFDAGAEDMRAYLRGLWETWWRLRDREARLILPEAAWNFAGLRPFNHPHRRLGALATVAHSFGRIKATLEAQSVAAFREALEELSHPHWDRYANLATEKLPARTALVGSDRAMEIVINVFLSAIPFEDAWARLRELEAGPANRKVQAASRWLTGRVAPALCRPAVCQQGLLQLHGDFFPDDPREVWDRMMAKSGPAAT